MLKLYLLWLLCPCSGRPPEKGVDLDRVPPSQVADPAGNLASSPEGSAHIVRLLRAARRRAAPPATARPPWWRVGGHWPPQRRAAAPTMWTAVDALDPNRQGRTLDGEVYYWNRALAASSAEMG